MLNAYSLKTNLWQPTFLVLKYFFSHEMMLVDGTYFFLNKPLIMKNF